MSHIHPTAVVDPSARIGRGVRVGPWCVVGRDAEVGDDSELVSNVVLGPWTVLGRENVIHPFAVVGGDPQDRKFQGEMTRLEVGDRNQIREHVSIHRGTGLGGGITRIGSDNLIMGVVHIAHDCLIGNGTIIAIDVDVRQELNVDPQLQRLSRWRTLKGYFGAREGATPGIGDILYRAGHIGGLQQRAQIMADADHYLEPPVAEFPMMSYRRAAEIAGVGYRYAKEAIARWNRQQLPS